MKYKSQYFDTVEDLINEKDNLWRDWKPKRDRVDCARKFTNGEPTMTEEEAIEENRTEITNHMLGYRNIQQVEAQNYSIYASSNTLVEVTVDTGNVELDYQLSVIITAALNKSLYCKGKLGNLWRSVSGELPIASVAPLMYESKKG